MTIGFYNNIYDWHEKENERLYDQLSEFEMNTAAINVHRRSTQVLIPLRGLTVATDLCNKMNDWHTKEIKKLELAITTNKMSTRALNNFITN